MLQRTSLRSLTSASTAPRLLRPAHRHGQLLLRPTIQVATTQPALNRSSLQARSFSHSAPPRAPARHPPPPGGNNNNHNNASGGGGGFPIGNIFNSQPKREPGAALKEHGVDLTELARQGKLDPVIARDDEVRRTIQILSRRTKNNPVLVGAAGVGKTAIIESLAQRLVAGEVPESLKGKKLISIDLASIMSGTAVRGSFEGKLKDLIADIEDAKGQIIVFIDEIHQLLGLGKAEGSLTGSNMLKPALARGLQLAGATTWNEFRELEKDAALLRRFQKVTIEEPSAEQAITMLRGGKSRMEVHHGVIVSDAAIIAAVTYSQRYITDRQLPDKAIDLIDEAAAALRLARESKPEQLEALEQHLTTLQIELSSLGKDQDEASRSRREVLVDEIARLKDKASKMEKEWRDERERGERIRQAKEELERKRFELEEAVRTGQFDKASELRYSIIPKLEAQVPKDGQEAAEAGQARVTASDVARVVAKATGIPVSALMRGDRARLVDLESILRQRVVGQEPALHAVAEAVRLSRAGLHNPNRPVASFLFLGPTGVGKTELSKALAAELTGTDRLITLNMSEYHDKHTAARLIGAPPGFVGYEDGGELSVVRRHPHSVILFDEFEKAHPSVANILLQILDEGALTDSHGRKLDFKNTTIILTSNIGSDILMRPESISPNGEVTPVARDLVLERVRSLYPPELLNRLDEQIVFNSLSPTHVASIIDMRLSEIQQMLNTNERKIHLSIDPEARDWLAKEAYQPRWGAREVNRLLNKVVRQQLASAILKGTIRDGDTARFRIREEGGTTSVELMPVHEEEVFGVGKREDEELMRADELE
ncbi:BZ3500_MvSof-1268-A1-R1_Chr10-2g03019 [Microbotryum saponariae]|uniref:BZ3500_MvSof-1268-A1-R1_Chr10-2g03019 protein n=1 Tax=Microbotryum saponariae TaxID=289078 RepID=A0A2X0LB66_9BASI|nr:BZ3501_MvSof-1269-A2-R1_Chr10-2g02605 [Microbotryum saponariae]SDA01938.1 BZ3500_MvSof-1268-A1-R1_Chr10-2g03019 [Microbotryum saponariae]